MTTPDVPGYSLQQAQRDIATLRGQLAHLQANNTVLSMTVETLLTLPDASTWGPAGLSVLQLVSPGSSPTVSGLYADSGGNVAYKTTSGYNGQLVNSVTDTTTRTNATTGNNQISGSFTIPANDAQVNTVYRARVYGLGVNGSTSQLFGFTMQGLGASGQCSAGWATGIIPISTTFEWWVEALIAVTAIGASGTAKMSLQGAVAINGRVLAGQGIPFGAQNAAVGINTTAISSFLVTGAVGSPTGAPTITGSYSTCERIGP